MLSGFLSWLSERDMASESSNRVFVAVTANRTDGLPPEMLRAGRFDRIFGVDLPTREERADILAIHLRKRGMDPTRYDLRTVAGATDQFSGAELEEVVVTARHEAYDRVMSAWELEGKPQPTPGREDVAPTMDDLSRAASSVRPLAEFDSDAIRAIRDFCAERTEPVSRRYQGPGRRTIKS